jgi:hypothetical protein
MGRQLAENLGSRGFSPDDSVELAGDLIWGVAGIGKEINRNPRQTFHLLENGKLPARKIGGRWCASRTGLRTLFQDLIGGQVA